MAQDHEDESDTSEVSETEPNGGIYTVDRILSEKWAVEDEDDHPPGMRWLVKWDGYGIKDCTWEPKFNFQAEDGTHPSLDAWESLKASMNDHEFRNLVRKNRLRFEWAEKNPAAADKEERAKKLRALVAEKKRARPAISDNESEDEAAPVRPHKRNSQQQIISPEVTLADREAVDDSQLSDLFVGNDDDSSPGSTPSTGPADGDLFVRQSPKVRRPPLAQSESSLSDGEETDDSMMVKLSGRRRRAPQESARARGATDKRRPTRKSTQSPKSLAKRAETAPIPKPVTKPDEGKTPRNESRRPSQPQAVTATRNQQEKSSAQKSATSKSPVRTTAAAQRKTSTSIGDRSAAAAAPAVASVATAASSSSAIPSSGSIGQGTARRTAPGPGANGGIRLVNQPQTQQRTPWQNSDRLYTNLRSRGNADKRSRTEAAPDLSVLQIVNNVPAPVQSRSQAPRGDAYARRELGTRRVQEEDTVGPARRVLDDPYGRREIGTRRYQDEDMDDTSRRGSADGIVPLQPWETNKVPLVCSAWRLSNNCPRTAQQCRFMHRNKDANGDDYEVADVNGVVPPKYRNPALTCLFWLNNPNGCKKPAKQCNYAHRNTGHIPYSDPSAVGQHVKLDLTTEKESAKPDSAKPRDKRMMRPSELTCWYWTKERCRHSAENCQFQHYDTGTIADPPPSARWKHNANTDNVAGGNGRVARRASQPSARMESLHLSTYVRPVEADVSEEAQPRFFDDLIEHAPQQSVQPPRPPPPPPIEFPPAKASCEQLQTKIKTALKLEYNDIFARNGGVMDGRALLIYEPDQHAEELETITRWLLMHHVRVFSMHSTGAWDRFRQEIMEGGSGVVIAHPDFDNFTKIPGFGQVLRKHMCLWSLGYQPAKWWYEPIHRYPPVMEHDCIEIFPALGGFIFITDEVFESKPQVALKIVKLFCDKVEKVRQLDGPTSSYHKVVAPLWWRLYVQPELMENLIEQSEARERKFGISDPDVQAIQLLYKLLLDTEYIELNDPDDNPSLAEDHFPIISQRRSFVEDETNHHYFTQIARKDYVNANFTNIDWAAQTLVDLRRDYRHFYVVHTEPNAPYVQKWKDTIQTIAEVITPERCVVELQKPGEASLFDFCERLMPPLNGDGAVG